MAQTLTPLFPFQREPAEHFSAYSGILAASMGTGKTRMIMESVKRPGRMLVVAPVGALQHIRSQFLLHTNPNEQDLFTFQGARRHDALYYCTCKVILCGYPCLRIELDNPSSLLLNAEFDTVVFDEAHVLRNSKTKVHAAAVAVKADHRICMTGTPILNSIDDVRSLMHVTDTSVYDYDSMDEWKENHYRYISGDELALPEITDEIVRPEFTPEQQDVYEALKARSEEALSAYMSTSSRSALRTVIALITRMRQASVHHSTISEYVKQDFPESGKTNWVLSKVAEILGNAEKVVIFSSSVRSLKILCDIIEADLPDSTAMYTGDLSPSARATSLSQFNRLDGPQILLMSIQAGGVGIELTIANNVILLDPWWNDAIERQAIGRCYRYGQKLPVHVYRLVTHGSIEEWIEDKKIYKSNADRRFHGLVPITQPVGGLLTALRDHIAASPPVARVVKPAPRASWLPTVIKTDKCTICDEQCTEFCVLPCEHEFCPSCVRQWQTRSDTCPMCRAHIGHPVRPTEQPQEIPLATQAMSAVCPIDPLEMLQVIQSFA
jgi:SNF2 family DNA or RNA helicase